MSEFQTERAAQTGAPLTFPLGGEDFKLDPEVPSGTLFAFAEAATSGDQRVLLGVRDFLLDCTVEEDRERLYALLMRRHRSDGAIVTIKQVSEAMTEVMKTLSGSPFSRPSVLQPSPSPTGEKSAEAAGSEASTSTEPRTVRL